MPIRAQAHCEPIPGYRLIERLGGGGFGEVWKAEAPGGILKAIKFVHGTLTQGDEESVGVRQELKSLNRVKSVRHPYILSLERYDIIDGQLLIVMELADRNLWDRFKECQTQNLPGIPRDELLRYLEEAAEALDLMNIKYQLQHLDIKPQNLFLVHNHIKVADFGLVKDLEGMNTQVTGGVTAAYAAPETFDGVVSRFCDQYNLAIVYQEMLIGQRPFNGTNIRQLMMQQLTGSPDLKGLPSGDQAVIRRALSKKPDDRFPTCEEIIKELKGAALTLSGIKVVRATPRDGVVLDTPLAAIAIPETNGQPARTRAEPVQPEPPRTQLRLPQPVPERLVKTGDGVLLPALVIGLGRVGLKVVQQLRKSLGERFGPPEVVPHLRLLYLETDPETIPEAFADGAGGALTESEVMLARLNKPTYYLRPSRNQASIQSWANLAMLSRIPRNQVTTEGLRILGRLALADNYRPIASKLKTDLEAIASQSVLDAADRATRLGQRSNQPRVYIVASLGGGTGGGMFIDVAYLARRQLKRLGFSRPEIMGLFLLPPADRNARKSTALVNTYAALTELNHFSAGDIPFSAMLEDTEEPLRSTDAPFERTLMLPLPDDSQGPDRLADLLGQAGDYLCRELTTPLGRTADQLRQEIPYDSSEGGFLCQTFGTYRFSVPRGELLVRVGRALCGRLVQGWLTQDRLTLQKAVRARLSEQYQKHDVGADHLIASLQKTCERALGRAPETMFEATVNDAFADPNQAIDRAGTALDQLEALVGSPDENDQDGSPGGPLLESLDDAAQVLCGEWETKLTGLVQGLFEEPRFRLVGAEEASQQVVAMLGEIERTHQVLLQDLQSRCEQHYAGAHALLQQLQKGSWWPGRKAKMVEELRGHLEAFPKTRYQVVVLECLIAICQRLQEALPQRLHEFTACRQRLTEFLQIWDQPERDDSVDLGPGRHFLPGNANDLPEAVAFLVKSVKPEELVEIDAKVQKVVRSQFKSLLLACLAPTNALHEVQHTIQEQVETFVDALLGKATVASLYLKQRPGDKDICADIAQAFEEANPTLAGPHASSPEMGIMILPTEAGGERLARLAREVSPDIEVVLSPGAPDVYFYREQTHVKLADLPQLSLMAEEAYRQMTASGHFNPHTRTDITDWRSPT